MSKEIQRIVSSSAAEYLAFVASTGEQPETIKVRFQDENVWLNQHLKRLYADGKLQGEATIKRYLIVRTKGTREVSREVEQLEQRDQKEIQQGMRELEALL